MKTVYISIGNSDDKLTQKEWHRFARDVECEMREVAEAVHFVGFTVPGSQWQTMQMCIEVADGDEGCVRDSLRDLAGSYRQDSIAMAVVDEVELVKP